MSTEHDPEEGCPPRITTERFDIYHHDIRRSDANGGMPRSVYHAWFHSEDIPKPVCVVTINRSFMDYVEWIHVDESYRRQGIAMEVLRAIEVEIGCPLSIDGATDDGNAFCDAYEAKFPTAD